MIAAKQSVDLHRLINYQSDNIADQVTFKPAPNSQEVNRRNTDDVYEHACNITAWQQLYDQLKPGRFNGELTEVWLDGIQFFSEYTSLALRQSCMVWPKALWLGLSMDNGADGYIGSQAIAQQTIAIRPGGKEFELSTPDNYTIMGIVVDQQLLMESVHSLYGDEERISRLMLNSAIQVDPKQKSLICHFMQQVLFAGENHRIKMDNPVVSKVLRHNLLDSMMKLLFDANHSDERISRTRINHQQVVMKAREYILDHPQDAITIIDLCQHLHVSRRTLQNCFQQVLSINPNMYLKAIRLNAVRRELESSYSMHQTVQDAAMSWGFWHMSQFAVDYQTLFGELPSQSLAARGRLTRFW